MTKLVVFADKRVGFEICEYLFSIHEDIVRIYIRNSDEKYSIKIKERFQDSTDIFLSDELKNKSHIEELKKIEPDYMLTVYWPYILKSEIFMLSKNGCVNFHPALLPKNRGWYPHVHNIINETDAGVTLHFIDENSDTGPILAQRIVNVEPSYNAFTLYKKLGDTMINLFKDSWNKIKNEEIKPTPQNEKLATYYKKSDITDLIELDKEYSGKELINILRARSFGEKGFAYFKIGDKKIFLNLRLNYDGNF